MRPSCRKSILVTLVLIAALGGCAGGNKVQSAVPMTNGGSIIEIEAGNYRFLPNEIRVEKPGLLAIDIKNVSGSERNFTLTDRSGKILKSVDLHRGASAIFNVELPDAGVYKFYCNKAFHSTLGMKGQITVGR